MKCLEIIRSKIDSTEKYVFESLHYRNTNVLEFSYINKYDGKDIVVVPTQTTCNLGCKFCFLTELKIPYRNLSASEIVEGVLHVLNGRYSTNNVLLVSFMGCGEPLLNIDTTINSMKAIRDLYSNEYSTVRFAVASLIPSRELFSRFTVAIAKNNLQCKFHYSLHTPSPVIRKLLMPGAADISIDLVDHYIQFTGNSAEIHYSLMDEVNDNEANALKLIEMLKDKSISVKLLKLSEKNDPKSVLLESNRVKEFQTTLENHGIATEYYEPPGSDVGASCGQFLLDYYVKYSK